MYVMVFPNRDGSTESVPSTPEGTPHAIGLPSRSSSRTQTSVSALKWKYTCIIHHNYYLANSQTAMVDTFSDYIGEFLDIVNSIV